MCQSTKDGLNDIKHSVMLLLTFRHMPANCIATVVGHDQTILGERPSEIALNDPVIQADFREWGG